MVPASQLRKLGTPGCSHWNPKKQERQQTLDLGSDPIDYVLTGNLCLFHAKPFQRFLFLFTDVIQWEVLPVALGCPGDCEAPSVDCLPEHSSVTRVLCFLPSTRSFRNQGLYQESGRDQVSPLEAKIYVVFPGSDSCSAREVEREGNYFLLPGPPKDLLTVLQARSLW